MRKPTNRLARGGFTLIEILVVLVIMGFLVAMVAPKLAGISEGAAETADDTSLVRFSAAINEYVLQNDSIPSGLTNLVSTDQINFKRATATAPTFTEVVSISDGNALNGAEVLSEEFGNRMLPMLHHLNPAEAVELKEVVGGAVLALRGVDAAATGTVIETYARNAVQPGLPVMMIGAGFDSLGTTAVFADSNAVEVDNTTMGLVSVDANNTSANILSSSGDFVNGSDASTTTKTYARIGEAKNLLRIVMGVSNRNQMVVQGFLDESGVSSRVDEENYTYGDYSIIVPRLKATSKRFFDDSSVTYEYAGTGVTAANAKHVTFQAIKYEELDDGSYMISARTPHMGAVAGGSLSGQADSMVTVVDSNGHVIGERGGWFAASITKGIGKNLDGMNSK